MDTTTLRPGRTVRVRFITNGGARVTFNNLMDNSPARCYRIVLPASLSRLADLVNRHNITVCALPDGWAMEV